MLIQTIRPQTLAAKALAQPVRRTMLALFFALAAALMGLAVQAKADDLVPLAQLPAGTYSLDKTHASVTWKVSHLGLSNYTARFKRLDATLDLNPQMPEESKLKVTIDPTSVETDYPNAAEKDFNTKLAKGEEWFNAGKFPEITFVATRITRTGENTGTIEGDLSLLGVTKPLTLAATFNGAYLKHPFGGYPAVGFSATATLKRSDWGFATYAPMIGDKVDILIEAEFEKPTDYGTPKKP